MRTDGEKEGDGGYLAKAVNWGVVAVAREKPARRVEIFGKCILRTVGNGVLDRGKG